MGSVNGKVFSVMGPNNYQINSLGIFSGNDPVKNLGKRKHTPPCSSAELLNFSLQKKNGVYRGQISVVDMVFLVFVGFLYPPPAWKVFL